jgi:predicted Rossmann-fold nucleotide-binding protein
MPGGVGTMDELFETLTLIQTGILHHFPIVVFGKNYYQELKDFLDRMVLEKTISPNDLDLVKFTDDIDEGMSHIKEYIEDNYKIKKKKPLRWLFE